MSILPILNNYIDLEYKKFHSKICKTNYEILGIKIPILRKIAKDILKEYTVYEVLENLNDDYYETVMLQGLVIGLAKINYEEKIELINSFLPKIDNWAICDIFCSELKFIKENKEEFLTYLWTLKRNKNEYYQRFIIVILLDYYIEEKYLEIIFNYLINCDSNYFYVKMAISWCYSICLVKYFSQTYQFLQENKNKIDKWVFNKALQKGVESLRITKQEKIMLKDLKIK